MKPNSLSPTYGKTFWAFNDPDRRLSALPLLSAGEQRQILTTWNATQTDYPRDTCIHDLFEAQVVRTPDAVAVVFGEQQLTYRELNQQANQVARHLKTLGIGAGDLVAVYMSRSLEMIPALLGILKAGGAYVPLETNFPPARIQWILSSLQIRCLLTQSDHAPSIDALAEQTSALEHLICLDAVEPATSDPVPSAAYRVWSVADLRKLPDENLPPQNTPDDTAYIIFTSGSTGTPKGVVVRHRPVINLIDWVNRTFAIQESDRVLFVTSLCFDLSVYDIFGLLAAGGSIQVVSDQDIREPEQLLRLLYEKPITFWDSAPAMLQQLVPFFPAAQANPQISSLRLVFLSGDWIPVTLPDMLRATFPSAHVISLGGATEATVWSNYYPIGVVDPQWNSIPYGKPIQNAQYYILDQQLNPCPIGVPGDLYIGGECLASGYANEPTLTAEKFIPDPFRSEPGATLYKTGDRARFWPDGTMEFLGRRDHQVKIRGFRVELGEIEAVLSQHPAVRDAVVVARATDRFRRDIYLAAYVIAHPRQTLDVAELRRYVQKRLPEYMTPGAFVILDEIPVTANGKVDRKALPEPERGRAEMTTVYVTPRNSIEDTIAGIWTEVLEIDRVGVYDNFFELGGHSLLATQVISRVQGTFQVDLPLRALFDGPTVANLANRVDIARAEKQGMRVPPIAPVAWDDGVALSLAQERLWLIDQFVPGNTAYISTGAARIRGPLDEEILERCFQEVIRRHAILRTNFHATRPLQFIHDQRPFSLNKVDLRALPPDERETHATRIAVQQAQHPFTLSEGTLMRVSLIRIEDEDYLLALATHHIIYDLMSIGIYIREMRALYEAFVQGKPSPLPELPVQYADFADWQQRWMQQEVMAAQLPYWKEQLRGANMVLELPTDRPRPPIPSFRGVRHSFGLSPELTKALRELGHKEGVTPFMLLLAAFDVLLYRYSGQDDIIVGSPVANRNRTEIEGVIGFFVNILSLRTDMSGNPTFRELVGRVREVCLGAYMHQDLPFARLVEELQPERDLSRNPIFQVVFNFLHNYMMPVPNLMDLSLELLRVHAATEQFDLTLDFWERPEGLQGSIDYNTDLFDETTIARMVEHLIALLDQITANPDVRITNVELMREAERRLVLAEWSSSAGAPVQELCVHELFEQQVERAPAAQAVVYEDHALSYAELNQRANQLAHYLRERGVGPEVIVGICVERSLDMIVGLLGILKAGGAYLPLDPLYPRERLAFMLEDAGAAALVTQHDLLGGLPQHPAHTICLDTDWAQIAHYSTDNPSVRIAPDHPAYIIYTSGSTGKPKGAVIPHRALSNYTQVATVAYNLTPEDRVLQFASISFDASAEEIYPTLTSGAALVLRTDAMPSSVTTFLHMCRTWGLTIIDLPTTYWHELVVGAEAEALLLPESLRLVIIGGERALPERLAAWQRIAGAGVQLVNTYGPTEATIVATMYSVPPLDSDELREIPIGRAIPQGQTYILDQRLQPTPIGVPGELCIGGAGLARGYLQRPALTAVAFVPDSFSNVPGARLYKTGDLARYLPSGQIEFVGRADHQVKTRGFRIELDEIAAALDQHPAVQESLVVAREEGGGAKRLVGYVVPTTGQTPTTSELYSFLKERLPGYMVPAAFVTLEALPLTPNGKIDRRVLPAPDQTRPELERAYVAPHNAIEEVLSGMWAEALGVEQVGVYDNFFELGGHSLLATQLISQVRELFQIEVTLQQLFQEPHVAGLAEALARDSGAADRIEKTAQLVLRLAQVSDDDLENTVGQHA
jgi:amino acid adenylation domain-containing protein